MTREENILTLNEHLEHWKRLLSEKICGQDEGEKTIDALQNAIKALEQEPCEDVVNRSAVLKAIDVKAWEFCDYLIRNGRNDEQKPVSHFADNLRECVGEDLPSVKPMPKMGKWIYHDGYIPYKHECSECGKRFGTDFNYCPECGADMRGDANVNDK